MPRCKRHRAYKFNIRGRGNHGHFRFAAAGNAQNQDALASGASGSSCEQCRQCGHARFPPERSEAHGGERKHSQARHHACGGCAHPCRPSIRRADEPGERFREQRIKGLGNNTCRKRRGAGRTDDQGVVEPVRFPDGRIAVFTVSGAAEDGDRAHVMRRLVRETEKGGLEK